MKRIGLLVGLALLTIASAGDWKSQLMSESTSHTMSTGWYENAESAFAQAKKQDLPVMLVIYSYQCPVCREFLDQTTNRSYMDAIARNVIPLRMTQEQAYAFYGTALMVRMVPTIFLFTPDSHLLVDPIGGAPNLPKEFIKFLEKVKKGYRNLEKSPTGE